MTEQLSMHSICGVYCGKGMLPAIPETECVAHHSGSTRIKPPANQVYPTPMHPKGNSGWRKIGSSQSMLLDTGPK